MLTLADVILMHNGSLNVFSLFQRVEQIMSRTRQTASPVTTEESNTSAAVSVGLIL